MDWTMATMIVGREHRVGGVFPLEHAGRVRDANVEAAVGGVCLRRVEHRGARMLLEHVPDHLNRVDVVLTLDELDGFIQPTDRRPERGAPRANLSLALERAQRIPELRVAHVLHLRVVELEDVDVVGLEALEAPVDRVPKERGVGAHWQLGLAAPRLLRGLIIDVVSNFRRENNLMAPAAKRVAPSNVSPDAIVAAPRANSFDNASSSDSPHCS